MSKDCNFTTCPDSYIEIYSIAKALSLYSKGLALNSDICSIDIQFFDEEMKESFFSLEMDIRHRLYRGEGIKDLLEDY